jgi:8-oxo-dGTP diphosphatase
MDWSSFTPRERAVLCFIVKNGRILLILKKRGLGAGKVNGPGGKIEPGETPLAAAIRETQEEIGVTPREVEERGHLHFQFVDGYSLHCTVFLAAEFDGTPTETDEADPFWAPVDAIPYHDMWEDDQYWLPHMLARQTFLAYFTFNGENLVSKKVELREEMLHP